MIAKSKGSTEMSDTRIKEGREIVSGLLDNAVDEWASSSTHDGDDWQRIDILQAEQDFANCIIERLTDDAGATTELIVKVLMQSACSTFESLVSGWDDEMLADVPAIVSGLARAEAWLKEGENE
jgi:hypothetical protein